MITEREMADMISVGVRSRLSMLFDVRVSE